MKKCTFGSQISHLGTVLIYFSVFFHKNLYLGQGMLNSALEVSPQLNTPGRVHIQNKTFYLFKKLSTILMTKSNTSGLALSKFSTSVPRTSTMRDIDSRLSDYSSTKDSFNETWHVYFIIPRRLFNCQLI